MPRHGYRIGHNPQFYAEKLWKCFLKKGKHALDIGIVPRFIIMLHRNSLRVFVMPAAGLYET